MFVSYTSKEASYTVQALQAKYCGICSYWPKGLNSSKVRPSLTFVLSNEKSEYKLLNDFHTSPSARYLNTPSFVQPSTCHLILYVVWCDINNLYSLGMIGNHHNTLARRFLLDDIGWPSSSKWISSFHLDSPHLTHESKSFLSFDHTKFSTRNRMNRGSYSVCTSTCSYPQGAMNV
jgi:hypothetical protein